MLSVGVTFVRQLSINDFRLFQIYQQAKNIYGHEKFKVVIPAQNTLISPLTPIQVGNANILSIFWYVFEVNESQCKKYEVTWHFSTGENLWKKCALFYKHKGYKHT